MSSNIYNMDLTRTLPPSLKADTRMLALAKTISTELQKTATLATNNIIFARIDELEENVLDILAGDLHIDWYYYASSVEIKRKIIKNSIRLHKKTGTKYAIESVVSAYFGSGEVLEWFEYGGDPFHFKIITDNPSVVDEKINEFLKLVNTVKRKSIHLEGVLITLITEIDVYYGNVHKDFTREKHVFSM